MNSATLRTVLLILAAVAIVAGLGLALYVLAAPIGVWLNMWTFREGFGMLRSAGSIIAWVTFTCALITVLLWVLGNRAGINRSKLAGMAGLATVVAAIAWYIPQSYLPGGDIPPIHDISTDVNNPPEFVDVLALRGSDSNPTEYGTGNSDMTVAEHIEAQQRAYPDVTTQVFSESPEEVFSKALAAVETLGWDLVAQVPEEGRIEATDTTFWFRFKDDVVIRISSSPEGTLLDARSTSRVGLSDVGKNAARLREFFAAL